MTRGKAIPNNVRSLRKEILLSKAELARKAGISPLTVDRVENGAGCRLDTKRKIILALGKKLEEKELVFPDLGAEDGEAGQTSEVAVTRSLRSKERDTDG